MHILPKNNDKTTNTICFFKFYTKSSIYSIIFFLKKIIKTWWKNEIKQKESDKLFFQNKNMLQNVFQWYFGYYMNI